MSHADRLASRLARCRGVRCADFYAIYSLLLSTGIRVGEMVRLNIDDIDFSERECVVYGKGVDSLKVVWQIDTTLRYALVNQNNVKLSHRKYIS